MQITAPRNVFQDYAADEGYTGTDVLFPTREEDPILDALLSIPWKGPLPDKDGMHAFRRGLDLPEYHDSFRKIASPATAFYRGEMIGKQEQKFPGKVIPVPEIVLFGSPSKEPMPFPHITKLFEGSDPIAFEIDDLVMHVPSSIAEYQKGVVVTPHGKDLVELSQLVEHPGQDLAGVGYNLGWYYRISEKGIWTREKHEKECPCGHDVIHQQYFESLKMIEHFLAKPKDFD